LPARRFDFSPGRFVGKETFFGSPSAYAFCPITLPRQAPGCRRRADSSPSRHAVTGCGVHDIFSLPSRQSLHRIILKTPERSSGNRLNRLVRLRRDRDDQSSLARAQELQQAGVARLLYLGNFIVHPVDVSGIWGLAEPPRSGPRPVPSKPNRSGDQRAEGKPDSFRRTFFRRARVCECQGCPV